MATMIDAQAGNDQYEKILSYIDIDKKGRELLTGGNPRAVAGLEGGCCIEPTIFRGTNDMRIFQEERPGTREMLGMTRGCAISTAPQTSGTARARLAREGRLPRGRHLHLMLLESPEPRHGRVFALRQVTVRRLWRQNSPR